MSVVTVRVAANTDKDVMYSAGSESEEASISIPISSINASVSTQSVDFDGKPSGIQAYYIDGANYFAIRDIAQLLNGSPAQFSVTPDEAGYSIQLKKGEAYISNGGEMAELGTSVSSAGHSQWKLTVDGAPVTSSAYNINGSNFYKLRDLSSVLGFHVDYNAANNHVQINSSYSPDVPQSGTADPSWFDDAVFCGDSLSTWLRNYAGSEGLGNATFLTATSFGIMNALSPVTASSVHPSYQGTKMLLEDAIAKCGANKVYLMFGINDIDYGLESATESYVKLVNNILAKSPGAQIYIESATPMLSNSKRADEVLNNASIDKFNQMMKEYCKQNGWNYLDIASVFKDENGGLRADACSDASTMGLHVTYEATREWVSYLRTHTR